MPSGERKVLELIAAGAPLDDTLDALCRMIDEQSGLISSVFLLNREGDQLALAAGPRLHEVCRQATSSFQVTSNAGACGAAVLGREQVIIRNVLDSPLCLQWRDALSVARIGSVWSTPFFSKEGQVLGTFAIADHESRSPSDALLRLVDRATHLASIAVERHLPEKDLREEITERRRAEERLRNSEYLLAEAQRLAHIGSWNWDLSSRTVTWSDELYRIFGTQPHQIDPVREAMSFIHPDDVGVVETAIDNTFKTKEPYSFFYRIRRRDGAERMLHSRGYLVSDEHGDPISLFGTTQDVTERRQAEEALRRSEQLLRLVLEALPVAVAVIDPAGDVILNNPASMRMWGAVIRSGAERYTKSKAWWHDTGKRVEPDEWPSVRAYVKGETSIAEVIDIEAFDGVRKVIQSSAVPIRDEHQAIVGAVIINEDISARKAAERDLEASVSQMQTLATRLMHAQDDERRHIAQMLHETTAQDLAALKMLLARLNRTSDRLSDADRALLDESVELAERSMSGVRTLSYLLHPPFLDEAGLLSAVRWYAEGFANIVQA